jgi:hypothetical protein
MIKFSCPHCGNAFDDLWEVLPSGCVDEMLCDACQKPFSFALMNCERCDAETSFTWAMPPPSDTVEALACVACKSKFVRHEDQEDDFEIL